MRNPDLITERVDSVCKYPVNRPCCICSTHVSDLMYEMEFPDHGYPGVFAMRQCQNCGLLFNSPRISDDTVSDLYDAGYYFHRRDGASEIRRVMPMVERLRDLAGNLAPGKRVLEIGSGNGYLLAFMRQFGWDVQGVDISKAAAAYAENVFNVATNRGTLEEFIETSSSEKYDLVVAIDLIEHVLDPPGFIRSLTRAVKPGGMVYIDTPNSASEALTRDSAEWKGFNPYHVYIFSAANLRQLFDADGFEVVEFRSYRAINSEVNRSRALLRWVARSSLKWTGLLGAARRARLIVNKTQEKSDSELRDLLRMAAEEVERGVSRQEDQLFLPSGDLSGNTLVMLAQKKS